MELADKPAKPAGRRSTKKAPSPEAKVEEVAEIPGEAPVEVSAEATPAVELADKPAKPAVRRSTKKAPSPEAKVEEVEEIPGEAPAEVSAEAELSAEPGKSDATT